MSKLTDQKMADILFRGTRGPKKRLEKYKELIRKTVKYLNEKEKENVGTTR